MDWREIVERLVKVERDVSEWAAGLAAAEKEHEELLALLQKALPKGGRAAEIVAQVLNGGYHKPEFKPPPPVRVKTHDHKRRFRALDFLEKRGGYATSMEFARADGCEPNVARDCLQRLAQEGRVHRVAKGRYALGPQPKGAA